MDFRKPKTLVFLILGIIALFFLLIFITVVTGNAPYEYYRFNKTIGWAWEIYNLSTMFLLVSMLMVLSGYILLWIFSARLNKTVSLLNLVTLLFLPFILIVQVLQNDWIYTFMAASLSVILFLANTVLAIRYKLKDK